MPLLSQSIMSTSNAQHPIKLIVGLCNPGSEYETTRHNAGAWLVQELAKQQQQTFTLEKKFKGWISSITLNDQTCWLLLPTTYMNLSGQAVQALARFHKILPQEIVIVHDELDFPPGVIRLKWSGSSGGHNGIKDVIAHLNTPAFYRLRIGIGHPGNRAQVLDYVLHAPGKSEKTQITTAITHALSLLPDLIHGKINHFMQQLHLQT